MQAGQLMIESHTNVGQIRTSFAVQGSVGSVFVAIVTRMNRLFGCWHSEMSRPFSSQGQTYRTCLSCGAQRQFNLKRWEMQGEFYYRLPTSRTFAHSAAFYRDKLQNREVATWPTRNTDLVGLSTS